MKDRRMDDRATAAIRVLSIEAIQKAKSGHPGMPLGAAPMAYELWAHHMKHNPKNPSWMDRDRFVLSAGHASSMLYAMLYLFGYGLTRDDIANFRQLGSRTPGHPEYGHTVGVETTTGPLGQGFAIACGMAMAEARLAATYNTPEHKIIDHYTYVLCGDGDLMEGVSAEAASLAGTLKLGKLIVLYDSNDITIEGSTDLAFTEDVGARFESYGWHVLYVADGNDRDAVGRAIEEARSRADRPSLITVKTKIGYGSPREGSSSCHGAPLGEANVDLTKQALGWPEDLEPFEVPEEILQYITKLSDSKVSKEAAWNETFDAWKKANPDLAEQLRRVMTGCDLDDLTLDDLLEVVPNDEATRASFGRILNAISEKTPCLFGGSADLAPSNNTVIKSATSFSSDNRKGASVHFGVREFAMAAIANGIALHGGFRPYVATFLVFSDYLKAALRLSALMKLPVIYVLTHDSLAVGEDGPTHQPVEQLVMLRSIPGVRVYRPAGRKEVASAWFQSLAYEGPSILALSRQGLVSRETDAEKALKGAYVLRDGGDDPELILMASGSEVEIALGAADILGEDGIQVRVVSFLSMEVFNEQDEAYKNEVLPPKLRKRVAVEAASPLSWHRYVGLDGAVIGIDQFGMSGPGNAVMCEYGFTAEHVADVCRDVFNKKD